MSADETHSSPRLALLRRAVQEDDARAIDAFRQELAAQETPLVEPIDGAPGHSLVTFVWFATPQTQKVSVQIAIDGSGHDRHEMSRLLDTSLWYATFHLRNDYRGAYKFLISESPQLDKPVEHPDPLSNKTFVEPRDKDRPDHSEDDVDSLLLLPDAPRQPWLAPPATATAGRLQRHRFYSHTLDNERRIWVYTPAQYNVAVDPYGLLVVLDGRFFTFAIRTPQILDYLLAKQQIAPVVAVMVDNPGDTWEQSMAIREKELACYAPFADFLAEELLPWLGQNHHVTTNPRKTLIAGGSFGGLAAAYAGQQRADIFGNVLALSGSFWWKPDEDPEWEWLSRQFAREPRLPLRFYLEVGLLESHPTPTGFPGQVLSNRHLRNVLRAKGYEAFYQEQMHGHDASAWPNALADGLRKLIPLEEPPVPRHPH